LEILAVTMYKLIFGLMFLALASCAPTKSISRQKSSSYFKYFHEGVRFQLTGDYQKAIEAFEKSLLAESKDDAAAYGIALCLEKQNQAGASIEYLQRACNSDPRNNYYKIQLAKLYQITGEFQKAAEIQEKLIAVFPENEQLYYAAASNYTSAKNLKRALKTLDNLRSRYGNSPDLVLYRYDVLLKACPTSKMGIELLEKSILEFPNDPGILSYLVDYYMTNENYSKGTEFLEQLVLADETNALACLLLGDITFEAGKKDQAFAYYKKALKGEGLNVKTIAETFVKMKEIWLTDSEMSTLMDACERDWPTESLIFALLGDYYYAQKNLLRTIYYYKKAVELNPDLNAIWNELLLLEFEVEDWPSLRIDGSKVIELFPLSPLGYYMSGTAMNRLGEYSLAKSMLEEGIFFVSNDDQLKGGVKAQLAESCFGVMDVKAGLKLYEESLRLSPNNNYILNLYFKSAIFKLKDPKKARELYEMLIISEMNENRKKESLALLCFVEKKFKEAFNMLEGIEQSYFRYSDVLELQGDVLFFLDKKVEAQQKWQEAKTKGKKSSVLEQKLTTGIYHDPL